MASWDVELAEPIVLSRDGRRFRTLRDAATFLSENYGKARGGVLAGAVQDLMAAAEAPTPEAVRRATHQFARFLADENLIAALPTVTAEGDDLEHRIREMLAGRGQFRRREVAAGVTRRRNKPKGRGL